MSTGSFEKWLPPPPGWIKINSNAATITKARTGLGWVARDHEGRILEVGVKRLKTQMSAEIAEAAAARWAIQCASERSWDRLIIESDAKGLISKLHSGCKGRAYVDLLVDDIRSFLPCFRFLYASHVKRLGNTVAHFVARMCPEDGKCSVFRGTVPCNI